MRNKRKRKYKQLLAEEKKRRAEMCSSGKKGFSSSLNAELFRMNKGDGLTKSYRCPECFKWHVSSQRRWDK